MKKKILLISDHILSPSGVGIQSKYLVDGLINMGKYKFIQIGGAKDHKDYTPIKLNDDLVIIPTKGFGSKDMIRSLLVTEKPEAIILFTDPRFFEYIFDMEDEIHQVCPILYWHVWDNRPYPSFNDHVYKSVDSINCISYLTYMLMESKNRDKSRYIPHSLPSEVFFELDDLSKKFYKSKILGEEKSKYYTGLWINRNARRKRSADVLKSWQMFLFDLEHKCGHRKANLIMHTDPLDVAGPNLFEIAKMLKIEDTISFSVDTISNEEVNVLHNISDFCMNISLAEGFGLSTLESMQVGNPIIAVKTGGQTNQVINRFDNSINGFALTPDVTTISGSQDTYYINEDFVKTETVSKAIMEMYELGKEKRKVIGLKAKEYVNKEFSYEKMIKEWDSSLEETIENWKQNYQRIRILEVK
jgi:glycosyltransferase involved in cell wall biosynthesis